MSSSEQKHTINYTREAFVLPVNLVFLCVMTVLTVGLYFAKFNFGGISWEFTTFLTASLELLYLGLITKNQRFVRAVNSKYAKETNWIARKKKIFQLLSELDDTTIDTYLRLSDKKNQIQENFLKLADLPESFIESYIEKIEQLEVTYLELAFAKTKHQQSLNPTDKSALETERKKIEQELKNANPKTKELLQRRLALIDKRLGKDVNLQENLKMLTIQMDTLKDTIEYLIQQSLTIKSVDEFNQLIDIVVEEAEQHEASVQEIQKIIGFTPTDALLTIEEANQANLSLGNQNQIKN
ncbi:MAG: hypothetical protein NZ108_03745 [Bacteroidia bacterium]|nr:hypothetical protein [Bacteroidia bacterium]